MPTISSAYVSENIWDLGKDLTPKHPSPLVHSRSPHHLQPTTKGMGNGELLLVGTNRKKTLLLPQALLPLCFSLLYHVF